MRYLALACALACGCGNDGQPGPLPDLAKAADDMAQSSCMHTVACTDNSIQDLSLFKTVNTALVEHLAGDQWHVDASGGGMSPSKSFVYLKFTDQGLARVDLSDEAAFASVDWDIALRRYVFRLNSGVSGPSCVLGAKVADAYDTLTKVPANFQPDGEAYYDAQCKFVGDASGLNAPSTVFADYWTYTGCLQMTGNTYVVQTAAGRHVKATVDAYYAPQAAQDMCNQAGSLPPQYTPAQVVLRWAFLD